MKGYGYIICIKDFSTEKTQFKKGFIAHYITSEVIPNDNWRWATKKEIENWKTNVGLFKLL